MHKRFQGPRGDVKNPSFLSSSICEKNNCFPNDGVTKSNLIMTKQKKKVKLIWVFLKML